MDAQSSQGLRRLVLVSSRHLLLVTFKRQRLPVLSRDLAEPLVAAAFLKCSDMEESVSGDSDSWLQKSSLFKGI